jgi:hypothetical protein
MPPQTLDATHGVWKGAGCVSAQPMNTWRSQNNKRACDDMATRTRCNGCCYEPHHVSIALRATCLSFVASACVCTFGLCMERMSRKHAECRRTAASYFGDTHHHSILAHKGPGPHSTPIKAITSKQHTTTSD